jgi:DNA polymerase I-like protein with 3'-5' exonuclease and polymerase domains
MPNSPLIISDAQELRSVMFQKMEQRTGIPFPKVISPTSPIPSETDFLIFFGENLLKQYKNEDDLFRWMGRKTSVRIASKDYPCTFLQRPSLLLPRYQLDDEPKSQLFHRPNRFQGIWVHWMQRALMGTYPQDQKPHYIVDPSLSIWEHWVKEALASELPLSCDIETAYKVKIKDEEEFEETELQTGAILRISFSYKPFHAISVAYGQPYFNGIFKLLKEAKETIWHNGANFDVPRLRQEGISVNGVVMDCQDAWHLLESQLPKGLEFVSTEYTPFEPWKHLNNADFGFYSCRDADAALQNFYGIKKDLEYFGMWNLFLEDSVELMPILERAGKKGNAIDVEYSERLKAELKAEKERLTGEVQQHIPFPIFPRKRFVKQPFEDSSVTGAKGFLDNTSGIILTVDGRKYEPVKVVKEGKVCSHCNQIVGNKTEHFKGGKKNPCKAASATINKEEVEQLEWNEILPFNLGSHTQIKELIRHYGHELGYDRKTEQESANRKHLEKLQSKWGDKYPFYGIKIEEAKVSKTLSTYCAVDLVEADGLLHTHFVNNPWSWRLASTAINMQTWGKREGNPWAKKARRQIIARPGHVFVQADSTSIEAILTGFLINDPNFIQVAKESIHAYLCCQELGLEFNNTNIELVKAKHKNLYNQFKTAVYLLLYGGDPYLMFMENPKLFPTKQAAEDIQTKIYTILPKLKEWQDSLREKAKKEGSIRGIYGHRACFYDVYTFKRNKIGEIITDYNGNPKIKLGTDSKSVLAFPAQNGAGKFGRDSLRIIGNSIWGQFMTAACFVHDGYMLEVPEALKFEAEQFLVDVLTRPVPEMGGLRIPCESDMGLNWADVDPEMKTFKDGNPDGMKTYRKVMV